MSTLVKERKHDQIEAKQNSLSANQLPAVNLTCDDRALWIERPSELGHKATTNMQTSRFRLSQKAKKPLLLSKKERAALKEQIIDSYEKINLYTSVDENTKHYKEIERYMRTLSASNYDNSSKKEQSRNMLAAYFVLDSIKDKLTQSNNPLSGTKPRHQAWRIEDDIINSCLYVVYLMLDQKASSFSDDKELLDIGRNTFLYNALYALHNPIQDMAWSYPSTERRDSKNISNNCNQDNLKDNLKDFLQIFYYKKAKDEKRSFQKDMLEWYVGSLDPTKHSEQIIKPIQQFMLKDFRGDFAVIVREKRKEKNLTQKQLADSAGLERSMIAKIEGMQASTSLEATINTLTALDLGLLIYPLDLQDTISSYSSDSQVEKKE